MKMFKVHNKRTFMEARSTFICYYQCGAVSQDEDIFLLCLFRAMKHTLLT